MKEGKRVALVTGASRGIGHAIFNTLLQEGFFVIGTAKTSESVAQLRSKCTSEDSMVHPLDVTCPDQLQFLENTLAQSALAVDTLICNAGITKDNLLIRLTKSDWDEILDTNLTGTFLCVKQFLRQMLKHRFGRIVLIGSVIGSLGNVGQTNYAASKAALVGFAKSLAREVSARGITVNVVAPGFIETDMTAGLKAQQGERWKLITQQIPVGRLGRPQDVAAAVKFLVSKDAEFITGETLHVNGGLHMS